MFQYAIKVITVIYHSCKQLQAVTSSKSVVELDFKPGEVHIYSEEL
jgi:hypothetical protein